MIGKLRFAFSTTLIFSVPWLVVSGDAASAAEAPVAMVTDVSGQAEVMRNGSGTSLRLLTELDLNARVRLTRDTRAVVLYLQSGDQYVLSGPGTYALGQDQPQAEKQAARAVKLGPVIGRNGKPLQIRDTSLSQAGIVMRAAGKRPIQAVRPTAAAILSTRPLFEWKEIATGIEYDFVLKDEKGNTILARVLTENKLQLPAEITLDPGAAYRWSVSARGPDGLRYLSVYRFSVADAETIAAFENFYPQDSATIAARVAFAAWLERNGLSDEVAQYRSELNKHYGLAESRFKE